MIHFDDNLGAGRLLGSCEDVDLIYRILKNNCKGVYSPLVEVWHGEADMKLIPLLKVQSYSAGFAGFVKKDTDYLKIIFLTLLMCKKSVQIISNFATKKHRKNYFNYYFSGLKIGFKTTVSENNNIWICDDATIFEGINIAEGSIVGTYSIVSKSVPNYSVPEEVSAKVIKKYSFDTGKMEIVK